MNIFISDCIATNGQVQAVNTGTADSFSGCQGYLNDEALCTLDSVTAVDGEMGGVKYSSDGFLRCVDATAGNPAGTEKLGGFAISPSGQLCVDFGTVDETFKIGQVSVNSNGAVFMADITPA